MANTTGKKYGGRQKGQTNKITRDLKDMVMKALDEKGGVDYLAGQAETNPTAFLSLLGKCMPKEVNLAARIALSNMTDAELDEIIRSEGT